MDTSFKKLLKTVTLAVATTLIVSFFSSIDAAKPADIRIKPGVPILVEASENVAIQKAVNDLKRDLNKVFGKESPVITNSSALKGQAAIVVTCQGSETAALREPKLVGTEAHAVMVKDNGGAARVVLQGADTRGTIYAIYTFSDRFLDVPPLWFWASWKPKMKKEVVIPQNTNLRFGSPHVTWRAWFLNNQDLIRGWKKTFRTNDVDEAIFETMLRLKLNVINVGEDIGDYPSMQPGLRRALRARDRGLAVTTPYLASFRYWDKYWQSVGNQEPPKLALTNIQKFDEFWTYHINLLLRQKLEIIWGIGFRGASDQGFYDNMPDAPQDDAGRAKVIQDMISRQVNLLKKVTGQEHPVMHTMLYSEKSKFFAKGLLRPPAEPSLIWTFSSENRDHFPNTDVRGFTSPTDQPIGYYMNLQFTSSGSHLAQGESPWKMENNFRMLQAVSQKPLQFSLLNVGNIREFVLSSSANAQMMWDFTGYDTDSFVKQFCTRYFGAKDAEQIASLYKDFFASYWQQKKGEIAGFEQQYIFQDLRLSHASEELLKLLKKGKFNANPFNDRGKGFYRIVPADSGKKNQIDAVIKGTDASIKKLRSVISESHALDKTVAQQGRTFFNDNLRVQASFMLEANQLLNSLARALKSFPDKQKTLEYLLKAKQAIETMPSVLAEAEHDNFEGWYSKEEIFGIKKLKDSVSQAIIDLGVAQK